MNLVIYLALLITPVLLAGLAFILMLHFQIGTAFGKPIDQGVRLYGKRIFGDNKTYLGFLVMPLFTMIAGLLLHHPFAKYISPSMSGAPLEIFKFSILGFAYALGELPNSFIKRRLGIPPGERGQTRILRVIFDIYDNIDSLLAVGLVYLLVFDLSFYPLILLLPIGGAIHLGTDHWMRKLQLKT